MNFNAWIFVSTVFFALNFRFAFSHDEVVVKQLQKFNGTQKTVCFLCHSANERGVDVSTFDFAHYTETILGHISKILLPDNAVAHSGLSLHKLQNRFKSNVVFIKTDPEHKGIHLPSEAKKAGCDVIYIQKFGTKDSYPYYPEAFNDS